MSDDDHSERDELLEELRAWAAARALPDVEDDWHAGYETLRGKLLAWLEEQAPGSG